MLNFLGRIESISLLVPFPTFQQIPLFPLSNVLQLLNKRGRKKEKKSISLIATKL